MLQQALVGNITSLIAALQNYVTAQSDAGFRDVSSPIEVWVKNILNITEGLNLENVNLIKENFPAIDLADNAKRVAIQISSNVTHKKWSETCVKFSSNKLGERYSSLRVIGFCSAVRARNCPSWVQVEGPSVLLRGLKTLEVSQLEALEHCLRNSYDFSKLNPLKDKDCFLAVLSVLNRDALRHSTRIEGSYADAVDGLKEIKEIITCGTLKQKRIYAKPLSQYSEPYSALLQEVDGLLSQVIAEINRAKMDGPRPFYCLNQRQKAVVDSLRGTIMQRINQFCLEQNIQCQIRALD
jgi:hypothetical protein